MIRTLAMAAGLAISATAAQGAFTGVRLIGNDAVANAAASTALGAPAIVLRLYAAFDGLGDVNATPGTPAGDALLLNVALSTSFANIGISNGTFNQTAGTGFLPPPAGFFGFVPALKWDTFGTVGALDDSVVGSANLAAEAGTSESTTSFIGGINNQNPPNGLGNAVTLADGSFGVVLYQFTVLGSSPGANGTDTFGAKGPLGADPQGAPQDNITLFNDFLTGTFQIFTKNPAVPIRHIVTFSKANGVVPTPGTLALFGLAGLAAIRRRR